PARDAPFGGDPAHQPRQLRIAEHGAPHDPSGEQGRSPDQPLLAVEEYLQGAREAADDAFLALAPVVLDEAVEMDLAPEGQLDLLGVPEVREEPLRLPRGLLHAVEERGEARFLPSEALAPENRDRNEEDGRAARLRRADHVAQVLRSQARRLERTSAPAGDRLAADEEQHRLTARDE